MTARPATIVSSKVAREALATSRYLTRVLDAGTAGVLRKRDVHRAFVGAYLDFYVLLEEQVEYLFYGLLMGRLSASQIEPKVVLKSELTAKNVVLGGRDYADWLPMRRTIDRAEVFFRSGLPFSRLDGGHRSTFVEMAIIRDAIAHSGTHAATKFRSKIVGDRPIPLRERTPPTYLAGTHAGTGTRMDELITRAVAAFVMLCE